MSDELKPCPFCGGEARAFRCEESGTFDVQCQQCGAIPFIGSRTSERKTMADVIAAWNARAEHTFRIGWRGQVLETESSVDCDGEYYCTACGAALPTWADGAWDDYQAARFEGEPPFRHCPNCGAKVTEPPERTCHMTHVLLYDEDGVEGIECDECLWVGIHSWGDLPPERCPGCAAKVVG